LIDPLQRKLTDNLDKEAYWFTYYDDPLIRDTTVLYLLAKHFPARAKALPPQVLENIARPLERNEFNTLSASMTLLALDGYTRANPAALDKLRIEEVRTGAAPKLISSPQNNLLQAGTWSAAATGLRFTDGSDQPAWAVLDQTGYDRGAPTTTIKNGLEIVRDYTDVKNNALGAITPGQEIDVHVKIRATGDKGIGNVAIVDLLPGGFDPVLQQPGANGGASLRQPGSSWDPTYTDIREDRVLIYGTATPDVKEFVYRIKASASGKFIVPPAFAESMYDRRIQARAPGGQVLTVVHAH
jgi:uncharacterized protein YfaS (alpha-2-macroglobulin family)